MSISTSKRRGTRNRSLVRRLWILPLSVVVVALIGYAVSGVQSSTYTAQSTVVVTSVPGAVASGTATNAASLAATYNGALPSDPTLAQYVSRTAHVPATDRITALSSKGSVVRLRFTANSQAAAIAGARAIGTTLTSAHPASSVVTSGTLQLVQAPTTAKDSGGRWRAEVVFVVPLQSGPTEGINPDDAQHLATTYAAIIESDDHLLSQLGHATGESQTTVGENLSVVNEQNTSILELSFRAANPRVAAIGARTVANLISGNHPVAAGIIPASLQVVSLPTTPTSATTSKSAAKPVAIGAILGLILGIILLVGWERSDPRITDARDLSGQLGCPATPSERLSPEAAHALLDRWRSLADTTGPVRVAILPADAKAAADADALITTLLEAGKGDAAYLDTRRSAAGNGTGMHDDEQAKLLLVNPGPAESDSPAEAVALSCDLTVIAVRTGARVTDVRHLSQELNNFGIVPTWAVLTQPEKPSAGGPRVRTGALAG